MSFGKEVLLFPRTKNKIRNQDYCSSRGHVALPRDFVASICFLCSKVTTVKLATSAKRGESSFTWEACLSNHLGPVCIACIAQLVPLRTSWAHPTSMVPATLSRLWARGNFQKHKNGSMMGLEGAAIVNEVRRLAKVG